MRNLCSPEIAKYRDHAADKHFGTADNERALGGAFLVPVSTVRGGVRVRSNMRILASSGKDQEPGMRWDHVSVSHSDRCPTWEEMDFVKRLFFLPDEVCFQLHVAESENISNHPYCLHIWRPLEASIPLPPAIMVGVPGLELQP